MLKNALLSALAVFSCVSPSVGRNNALEGSSAPSRLFNNSPFSTVDGTTIVTPWKYSSDYGVWNRAGQSVFYSGISCNSNNYFDFFSRVDDSLDVGQSIYDNLAYDADAYLVCFRASSTSYFVYMFFDMAFVDSYAPLGQLSVNLPTNRDSIIQYFANNGNVNAYFYNYYGGSIYYALESLPDAAFSAQSIGTVELPDRYLSAPIGYRCTSYADFGVWSNEFTIKISTEGGKLYDQGREDGLNEGYNQGFKDGADSIQKQVDEQSATALVIFNGILAVGMLPVEFFLKILNFEVFGLNFRDLVTALLSVGLIVLFVKMTLGFFKKDNEPSKGGK